MSKIVAYQIYKLDIPLKAPFSTDIRTARISKGIFCQIALDDGQIGLGESAENIRLTGESREEMFRFAKDFFEEHLNNEIEDTLLALQGFTNHNGARYGMETAILDAQSKSDGVEISKELGIGFVKRQLTNDISITPLDLNQTIDATKQAINCGYHHIKYQLNGDNSEVENILQLEDLIPKDVSVRVDPDQNWTYDEAVKSIKSLEESKLNIEYIEQPVNVLQLSEMKRLSLKSSIPIIADEAVFTLEDAKEVIGHSYGDFIKLKLIKCGGPLEAIEIANFAQRKHINCLLGCALETNIAITMAAYMGSLDSVKYIDLADGELLEDSPFIGGVERNSECITIPKQSKGLGITLDALKAGKYLNSLVKQTSL